MDIGTISLVLLLGVNAVVSDRNASWYGFGYFSRSRFSFEV